jgi:hypothetical protein
MTETVGLVVILAVPTCLWFFVRWLPARRGEPTLHGDRPKHRWWQP